MLVVFQVMLLAGLTLETRGQQFKVCGRQLADLLDLICSGRGFFTHNSRGKIPGSFVYTTTWGYIELPMSGRTQPKVVVARNFKK